MVEKLGFKFLPLIIPCAEVAEKLLCELDRLHYEQVIHLVAKGTSKNYGGYKCTICEKIGIRLTFNFCPHCGVLINWM